MSSNYKILLKDPTDRATEIGMRVNEAIRVKSVRQEHKFRGGKDILPVISLPQDYPVYRLENYRTRDQQLSLIASGKVANGFFDAARREDPAVQLEQHQLLLLQAKRGSGESIKPIYDELARVAEQTEYLILTADGVVVNGNRRLCAMRELYDADRSAYGSFANVNCLILPQSATTREILELEIGLQMQPETKLPYEWTALGRAVRDLRQQRMDDEAIAVLMNRDKQDIQRAATMIDAADLYLNEWLRKPNAYNLLDDTEQAFKQIATRNWAKVDDPVIREQTRKFDFFVVEQRKQISDSAYTLINAIELNPKLFLDTIAAEWDIDLKPMAKSSHKISFDAPDDAAEPTDYAPLMQILAETRNDPARAKARVESLAQVCAIVGEQGKERERAALKFSRSAEKALAAIELRTADPTTHGEIATVLARCSELCDRVMSELASLRATTV